MDKYLLLLVPGAGVEPAYHIVVRDFKSPFLPYYDASPCSCKYNNLDRQRLSCIINPMFLRRCLK